jgi:hypothetical protein
MVKVLCIMAVLAAAMSFKPVTKSKLIIQFSNYVGNEKLVLDSGNYKNVLGQPFTVSMFKYYISNIHLKNNNGSEYSCRDGYFLVNEEDNNSKQIVLNDVTEGEYTSLSFTLGVDSLHNCSGAQSGALDPLNGMFWAWNTGYIFLKLEGKSAASHSNGNALAFHIGGYKQPNNCIRTITLNLKTPLKISVNQSASLNIKTDVSEIFKTPFTIDFSKMSSVTDFHNSVMIADNYKDMFSIKQ